MSYSDGARPTRKFGSKSPKKLCVTKSENSEKTTTTVNCSGHHHNHYHHSHHRFLDGSQPSVHKRNLYIVSFPLILLFNVLRTLLYQLFVVFKYLYTSTSQLLQRRQASKQACQLEIVVGQKSTDDRLMNNQVEGETMSQVPRRPIGPGPGDPLLAKQKHHHRRAFEFISKALKIDEDNEGILFVF
jgi:spastin